jgi:repressor LexA
VAALIDRLKEAGFIESTPGRRLAPTASFFGREVAASPVRAGLPQAVEAGGGEVVTLDSYLIEKPSRTVLIRVRGDSMNDAGILDGDLAVVECTPSAKRGDIIVAIVDDEFTLKRLELERGRFVLKPENKAFPVIRPQGTLEIFGVMVGLVRKTH